MSSMAGWSASRSGLHTLPQQPQPLPLVGGMQENLRQDDGLMGCPQFPPRVLVEE